MSDNMGDLFSVYPNHPGWKRQETSALAAQAVAAKAPVLRAKCLEAIEARRDLGATGNELAEILGWDICSIRPRLTELARLDKIHNTGRRRSTPSGCSAIVWAAGAPQPMEAAA